MNRDGDKLKFTEDECWLAPSYLQPELSVEKAPQLVDVLMENAENIRTDVVIWYQLDRSLSVNAYRNYALAQEIIKACPEYSFGS